MFRFARAKASKPYQVRDGDRFCVRCGAHNFSDRVSCFRCNLELPAMRFERADLEESETGSRMCRGGGKGSPREVHSNHGSEAGSPESAWFGSPDRSPAFSPNGSPVIPSLSRDPSPSHQTPCKRPQSVTDALMDIEKSPIRRDDRPEDLEWITPVTLKDAVLASEAQMQMVNRLECDKAQIEYEMQTLRNELDNLNDTLAVELENKTVLIDRVERLKQVLADRRSVDNGSRKSKPFSSYEIAPSHGTNASPPRKIRRGNSSSGSRHSTKPIRKSREEQKDRTCSEEERRARREDGDRRQRRGENKSHNDGKRRQRHRDERK